MLDKGRYKVSVDNDPKNPLSRGKLTIENLVDTDEGEYKCVASNNGGNVTDKVFVNTIGKVPPGIIETLGCFVQKESLLVKLAKSSGWMAHKKM